jgi:hypothetical protein
MRNQENEVGSVDQLKGNIDDASAPTVVKGYLYPTDLPPIRK